MLYDLFTKSEDVADAIINLTDRPYIVDNKRRRRGIFQFNDVSVAQIRLLNELGLLWRVGIRAARMPVLLWPMDNCSLEEFISRL